MDLIKEKPPKPHNKWQGAVDKILWKSTHPEVTLVGGQIFVGWEQAYWLLEDSN